LSSSADPEFHGDINGGADDKLAGLGVKISSCQNASDVGATTELSQAKTANIVKGTTAVNETTVLFSAEVDDSFTIEIEMDAELDGKGSVEFIKEIGDHTENGRVLLDLFIVNNAEFLKEGFDPEETGVTDLLSVALSHSVLLKNWVAHEDVKDSLTKLDISSKDGLAEGDWACGSLGAVFL